MKIIFICNYRDITKHVFIPGAKEILLQEVKDYFTILHTEYYSLQKFLEIPFMYDKHSIIYKNNTIWGYIEEGLREGKVNWEDFICNVYKEAICLE